MMHPIQEMESAQHSSIGATSFSLNQTLNDLTMCLPPILLYPLFDYQTETCKEERGEQEEGRA